MAPELGGKIWVLKRPWLMFILSGYKTMEIRSRALRPGRYYLGHKKLIYGEIVLGQAILIATDEHWNAARDKHLRGPGGLRIAMGGGVICMRHCVFH